MNQPSDVELRGGCMCGAVRYRAVGTPLWVVHCHCADCRRASGAVYSTWVGYRAEQVVFERDNQRHRYASSRGVSRSFCASCGTSLTYEGANFPGELHLMVGTLDVPSMVLPTRHVWTDEAISWALHNDGLKRRPRGPGSKLK